MVDDWRIDFPEATTSTTTIGDKNITYSIFAEDTPASMWYINDGVVFDIESGDEASGQGHPGRPPACHGRACAVGDLRAAVRGAGRIPGTVTAAPPR